MGPEFKVDGDTVKQTTSMFRLFAKERLFLPMMMGYALSASILLISYIACSALWRELETERASHAAVDKKREDAFIDVTIDNRHLAEENRLKTDSITMCLRLVKFYQDTYEKPKR